MKFKIMMLAVFVGLSVTQHAKAVEQSDDQNCIVQGYVQLDLDGNENQGRLSGWIGRDYVNMYVSGGYLNASLHGVFLNLQLRNEFGNDYVISGWINRTYVRWQSYGKHWNVYENCIPG